MAALSVLLKRFACASAVTALVLFRLPLAYAADACPPPPAPPTQEAMRALAREAKDRGMLWKIEKDGRSGHLYGTLHMGKPAWLVPGPKTLQAIMSSEVVALELDILDPSIQKQMTEPGNFGIRAYDLPAPLKSRLEAVAKRVCAPPSLSAEHPMLQYMGVMLFDARFVGLEAGFGSEVVIASLARGARKPIRSLETVESQTRLLLDRDQNESVEGIERGVALLESGKTRAVTQRMSRAWEAGDLADLADYQSWCECAQTQSERNALSDLNDGRNPGLAVGIDKLMSEGKNVFAAVGALHMTGPKGLPLLLEHMGYKVERVQFGN